MADPAADDLQELTGELERAAARLRAGELDPDAAAALVDECARLASPPRRCPAMRNAPGTSAS